MHMHRSRFVPVAALTPIAIVMLVTLAACGSSAAKVSGPGPQPDLARLKLVGGGGKADASIAPQQPPNYVLDAPLADLGFEAPVRTLVGHDVSEADVARFAAALGLHAAPARTDWGYEVRDGDALLNVRDRRRHDLDRLLERGQRRRRRGGSTGSGSSEPSSGAVAVPPDALDAPATLPPAAPPVPVPTLPPPVDVPSSDDAARIAQSLLDGLGVLDGQQWATDVTASNGDLAVACDSDAPCPVPETMPARERIVTYDLVLDGIRVPDAGWSVTIGNHGAVEAVSGTWARTEVAGSYSLRSTQDVFDDLQHNRAQFIGVQALLEDAAAAAENASTTVSVEPGPSTPPDTHVTGVALGIARWDGTEDGRAVVYLVPTYRFHAVDRRPDLRRRGARARPRRASRSRRRRPAWAARRARRTAGRRRPFRRARSRRCRPPKPPADQRARRLAGQASPPAGAVSRTKRRSVASNGRGSICPSEVRRSQ